MKKIFILSALSIFLLSGCNGNQNLKFENKSRTWNDTEEHIEDMLESENPTLDLEVDITKETKKKKRKRR